MKCCNCEVTLPADYKHVSCPNCLEQRYLDGALNLLIFYIAGDGCCQCANIPPSALAEFFTDKKNVTKFIQAIDNLRSLARMDELPIKDEEWKALFDKWFI